MNQTQKEKIARFLDDKVLSETVQDVLLHAFLKTIDHADVNVLAASRIAIDLLQEGWKDLERYKKQTEIDTQTRSQVGL